MAPKYVYVIYNLTVLTSLVLVSFAKLNIFAAILICILSAHGILAMLTANSVFFFTEVSLMLEKHSF